MIKNPALVKGKKQKVKKILNRGQHCGAVGYSFTCGVSIPYGLWLVSRLPHFRYSTVLLNRKSSAEWLKSVGSCIHMRGLEEAPGVECSAPSMMAILRA